MDRALLKKIQDFFTPQRRRIAWLSLVLLLAGYTLYLDITVRAQFEGKRWALPARVYARPLELYPGMKLQPQQLTAELALLKYRPGLTSPQDEGSFQREGDKYTIHTRPFVFWDGPQATMRLLAEFDGDRLAALTNLDTHEPIALIRLDPLQIGGIYPTHNEDRALVKLSEVPRDLINGLIAVEDRKFYTHHGIDPRGIARALVTTASGGGLQGGSTITQQLVKNFFLTSERSLRRKFTEVIMALLLELHYDKDEILEAYTNEIYLGQDANRAIHGFGLASRYYFDQILPQLNLPQTALLVSLVRGPSYYDPRRHPERAVKRRNLVLQEMREQNFITQQQFANAKASPLNVVQTAPGGTSLHPAFVELVRRQLRRDYRDEDLRSEGLRVFSTLDPLAQRVAEQTLTTRIAQLEKARGIPRNALEGAVVISNAQSGEVHTLVGGRDARYEGFNRALDAQRSVGSLIKPVIYLTALEHPESYTLLTPLDDSPLVWRERGADDWQPRNYDNVSHGLVPLRVALAESYNISAARLGLTLGLPQVLRTLRRLGINRELPPYASTLLGAVGLSPVEVSEMYQTLASGGFHAPLRAIREVVTAEGQALQRYPLSVTQVIDPASAYLITSALQGVVREGTASGLSYYLPAELHVAGKTGTTNDLRDSWFAGYTDDRVAVVWLGRDDNSPINMTGASGAMTVWGEILAQLNPETLMPPQPENIEQVWIDPESGLRADEKCVGAVLLPFIHDSAPTQTAACITSPVRVMKSWFKRLFE